MRNLLIPALATALIASSLVAQPGGERRGRRGPSEPVALEHFDFKEVEFKSESLTDGQGRYGLYLPKGWDAAENKDKKYPLIVWLHGFGGYDEFQSRGGAKELDDLRGADEIPELVLAAFVAPGGRRGRSVYVNGEANGKVEDAIAKDLVADVEKSYPVATEREKHAIMGVSIGGYGALKIAMKHPDLFGAVAAHSSAIFPDDPSDMPEQYQRQVERALQMGLSEVFGDPIDKTKWAGEMPMGLARKADKDTYKALKIYFDAGTEDRYGFAKPNQALDALMTEKGIAHTFRLVEGGGHAWSSDSMRDNLKTSLKFVAATFKGE